MPETTQAPEYTLVLDFYGVPGEAGSELSLMIAKINDEGEPDTRWVSCPFVATFKVNPQTGKIYMILHSHVNEALVDTVMGTTLDGHPAPYIRVETD